MGIDDAAWDRVQTLLSEGMIPSEKEREQLKFLLQTKKWNPYCLRHSSIEHDSGYLPEFALRKKVRWTLTSRQPGRYIKNKWTADIKRQILQHAGIEIGQDNKPKPTSRTCPKCNTINALENKVCSKAECGYPLTVEALEEIKARDEEKDRKLQEVWEAMYKLGHIKRKI
jgi:hypothetical protein